LSTPAPHASLQEIRASLVGGKASAVALVDAYCARIATIDRAGIDSASPTINAVVELNDDARTIAAALDAAVAASHSGGAPCGPLHGACVLIKDNIDTGDSLATSGGSLALLGQPATQDATVADRLRGAGAIILGKSNLSEWANFRSLHSSSGWSARGGLTRNPHILNRTASGSSSGSAAAVAAGLCTAALGTETDGSIVSPANACGVVGLKPTVGLTSRAGVIPIAASQDSVGIHAHTVADAAALLSVIAGPDDRDPATAHAPTLDYTQFLDPAALHGARIGVVRNAGFRGYSHAADSITDAAVALMRSAGATIVDPVLLPSGDLLTQDEGEWVVLLHEFKRDLNAYLATRTGLQVRSLADIIAFNRAHAATEMPWFGQELLELADADLFTREEYEQALRTGRRLAGAEGIDAALAAHQLHALVAPTGAPACLTDLVNGDASIGSSSSPAARAGYPLLHVPASMWHGLPVGITFMAGAWSEPTLIALGHAFECIRPPLRAPTFLPAVQLPPPEDDAAAHTSPASLASYLQSAREGRPQPPPTRSVAALRHYIERKT
jgi:amidase